MQQDAVIHPINQRFQLAPMASRSTLKTHLLGWLRISLKCILEDSIMPCVTPIDILHFSLATSRDTLLPTNRLTSNWSICLLTQHPVYSHWMLVLPEVSRRTSSKLLHIFALRVLDSYPAYRELPVWKSLYGDYEVSWKNARIRREPLVKVDILQTMHWVKKAWPLVKVETEQNCFYYGTPLMQLHPS